MKGKMIPSIPEQYRKRIEELTLADDIGFMQGFDGSIEGTEHLVRTLTGRDDITVISMQASLRSLGEGHRQDEEPDDEESSLQGEGGRDDDAQYIRDAL